MPHRLTRRAQVTFDTPRGRVTLQRGERLEPHARLADLPADVRAAFTRERVEPEPAEAAAPARRKRASKTS